MLNSEEDYISDNTADYEQGLTPDKLKSSYAAPNPAIDDIFLVGMSDVDWSRLGHAYGDASDVPALLRALLSHNHDHRDFALELLFQTVWHQGTVYSCSAYTVPFLTRLLTHPETPNKAGILYLLASLAEGHSYLAVHERTEQDIAKARVWLAKEGIDFDVQLREELEWVQTSRAAVLANVPTYLQLLDDPDQEVQIYARYTLSLITEAANTIIPQLQSRIISEDDVIRGHTLLALDALVPVTMADSHTFEQIYQGERNESFRALAALAVFKRQGSNALPNLVDELIQISTVLDTNPDNRYDTWSINARFYPGPWGSDRAEDLANAFASVEVSIGVELLQKTLTGILSTDVVYIFVERLLDLVFGGKQVEASALHSRTKEGQSKIEYVIREEIIPRDRQSLEQHQIAALTTVLVNDRFWNIKNNLLELYGLPSERSSVREWLLNI